jgi:hypothetical protein
MLLFGIGGRRVEFENVSKKARQLTTTLSRFAFKKTGR